MQTRKILLALLVSGVLVSCNTQTKTESNKLQTENQFFADTTNKKTQNAFFSDESTSSFYVISGNKEKGYVYQTVEINYAVLYNIPDGYKGYNVAKYIMTTTMDQAVEFPERNIKVEIYPFENPSKLIMKIDKDCDRIDLLDNTYKTTINGCCGNENVYEIFDYKHKSIIKTERRIVIGNFYNSKISFYVGFEKENEDSLGTLKYSYNSKEKYTIKMRTKQDYDYIYYFPDIEILSDNENDKFSKSDYGYTFFSPRKISDKNSINNLTIRLIFSCENGENDIVVDIPIINGKPFRKEDKIQELYIEK